MKTMIIDNKTRLRMEFVRGEEWLIIERYSPTLAHWYNSESVLVNDSTRDDAWNRAVIRLTAHSQPE